MADTIAGNSSTGASLSLPFGTFDSSIDFLGDTDWYAVALSAGWGYQMWLDGWDSGAGTLSDPFLTLHNAAGTEVAYNDDAGWSTLDSYLYYAPSAGGTYYLSAEAFAGDDTGSYRVTIQRDQLASTASQASVAVNGVTSGRLGDSADDTSDWTRVDLVAGVTYQFDLIGAAGEWDWAQGLTLHDAWLGLRNSVGSLLAADDDSGMAFSSRLFYTPTVSGTYFLDARSADGGGGSWRLVVNSNPIEGTIAVGGTANGSVDFQGDSDGYQVQLVAGVSYTFTLNGSTLADPFLELTDSDGSVLDFNDDSVGLDSVISYTATWTGTYYLAARGAGNSTGSYTLSATAAAAGNGDDYPASAATTGLLPVGSYTGGRIETSGDRDWIGVDLVAGQTYTFHLDGATASPLADPYFDLYSSAGVLLGYDDDSGDGLNSQLTYTAPTTGRYYLEARGYGTNTGSYVVGVVAGAAADTTAPIVLSFDPSDESTGVAAGANIRLTFSESIQRGTGTISLQTATGAIVESFDAATSSRISISGNVLTIDPTSDLAAGTSYRVQFASGNVRDLAGNAYAGTTTYNFATATASSDDYGATPATAGVLTAGSSIGGHLETSGDRDWFGISLSAGQTYTFRLNGEANGLSDPLLVLYDWAGSFITYNDDGGGSLNSLLSYTAGTSGTYFLEARAYSTQTGGYVLSASGADTTAPTVFSFSPADEATSVGVGSNITLNFNESVQRGTGTIVLKTSSGEVVESFDAATSSRLSISGATLTLDPTVTLSYGTSYRVEFGAGTVRDFAGNAYAGTTGYNFTTVAATGGDDYAANGATTGRASIGGSVTGRIETAGDHDWFAVSLSAGQTYTFRLNGASTNGLSDPYLTLYNGAGTVVGYNDDGGGSLNSLLTFTAATSGTYYLDARAYGSQVGDYVLSATGGTDAAAPVVLSFSPADESTAVAVGTNVTVTFDEAIQRGSGTIYLKTAAGAVVEAFDAQTSARLSITGTTLTIDPTENLANGTGYRVDFAAGTVRDLAGNGYAGTASYNFTTVSDTTAPFVTSFSPADETTSVAVTTNVTVTFSEAIARGAGTIVLRDSLGTIVEGFDAATSSRIAIAGATLTLDPTANLAPGTAYSVEFAPGTVRDLAGNAYAGTSSYNFSTASGSGGDDYAASTSTTGAIAAGGSVTGHIETVSDRDWFAVTLNAGVSYTIRLDAAATVGLRDPYLTLYDGGGAYVASNDDGGGNLNSLLSFTAGTGGTYFLEARAWSSGVGEYVMSVSGAAASDTTAPTVIAFSPANASGSVLVGANVVLTFSESVQRGSGTIVIRDADGSVVEAFDAATSSRIAVSGNTLTLDPTMNFANGASYSVQFGAGTVRDVAGNAYAGTSSYSFSTVGDTVAPTVVAFSPADEATSVSVGSDILVTFSEAVQRGIGTVYLKNAAGSIVEAFDAATSSHISVSGNTLTLNPTYDLAAGTGYRVEFGAGAVRDLSGNAYAGTSSYNFTTASAASGDDYAANSGTSGHVADGASATGHIEAAGDRDWFSVSLTAGQTYAFRLNGTGSNALHDPYLTLYSGSGASVATNDDGDNGLNSLINFTATTSGTYYLEARAYGSDTGEYTVSAAASTSSGDSGGGSGGTGGGASGFAITVSYSGDAQYQSFFDAAAARWAQVIIGDLPDVATAQGIIDDLLISASVTSIDGVGSILGQAGATAFRYEDGLPYQGIMQFDSADVANMVANGTFQSVVLHEMGHVLGFAGDVFQDFGLVSASNPYVYIGAHAVQAYASITSSVVTSVPLESTGGAGTAGSHWSEAVFDKELMTGWAEPTPPMPLSVVTIGALADLGYVVNYAAADPFHL